MTASHPLRLLALVAVTLAALLAGAGCSAETGSQAAQERDWRGCDGYTTQPQAQRAWEAAGRPAGADGDDDGRVCETLPERAADRDNDGSCRRVGRVVAIGLSRTKYPSVVDHIEDAIRAGYPAVLVLNRPGADERRDALLDGRPTTPGRELDEYPPAVARTAATATRAHVRSVPEAENAGSGATMGLKLRPYCDGQRFRLVGY